MKSMKKVIIGVLAIGLFLYSCSGSKAVREQRNTLSGTWSLDDISYENNQGSFKAELFNDAEAVCFEGSEWYFRDNNSTGRYTLNDGSLCTGGDRFIRWSVVEQPQSYSNQLQFKFIDAKNNDIGGGQGYRLNIDNLSPQSMTLKSNASVGGETVTLVYEFTKKSNN
jgi:hypothetical protein